MILCRQPAFQGSTGVNFGRPPYPVRTCVCFVTKLYCLQLDHTGKIIRDRAARPPAPTQFDIAVRQGLALPHSLQRYVQNRTHYSQLVGREGRKFGANQPRPQHQPRIKGQWRDTEREQQELRRMLANGTPPPTFFVVSHYRSGTNMAMVISK